MIIKLYCLQWTYMNWRAFVYSLAGEHKLGVGKNCSGHQEDWAFCKKRKGSQVAVLKEFWTEQKCLLWTFVVLCQVHCVCKSSPPFLHENVHKWHRNYHKMMESLKEVGKCDWGLSTSWHGAELGQLLGMREVADSLITLSWYKQSQ